jgi:hypothetical protein
LERETEERRADVSQTLANFSKSFAALARRTKADRLGSLSDLKRTVNDLRTEVHTDLSSIRKAWRALVTPSRGAEEKLESRVRQETKAGLEAGPSETGGPPPLVAEEKPESQARQETKVSLEAGPSEIGGPPPLVGVGGEKPVRKKRKHLSSTP